MERDRPRFSDLLTTQGELDVAKIQALLFTGLIGVSIVASGYSGLTAFNLPSQIVYLSMISQGALVFGKLLPTDTRRQVETDLSGLRTAAAKVRGDPMNKEFVQEYEQARFAAKNTLYQTYADLFAGDAFDRATADPSSVV